jgi:hypothetical protein
MSKEKEESIISIYIDLLNYFLRMNEVKIHGK